MTFLRHCSLTTLSVLAVLSTAGCSLKISSDNDGKPPVPVSECSEDFHCTGNNEGCHEVTDGNAVWDECGCATGYSGADCDNWDGIVTDGDFANAASWELVGGATIDPAGTGPSGSGLAEFDPMSLCNFSKVTQMIPGTTTLDGTGPLVAEISLRIGPDGMFPAVPSGVYVQMGVGLNGRWSTVPASDSWQTHRICVGEAVMGGDLTLSVGSMAHLPEGGFFYCDQGHLPVDWDVEVSDIDILPANANECPEPGVLANGDMEANSDWTEILQSGNGTTAYQDLAGKDGSRALVFSVAAGSGAATRTQNYSFPADPSDANALAFWIQGTAGRSIEVRAGQLVLATIPTDGAPHDVTVCLPGHLAGVGQDINFGPPLGSTWPSVTNIAIDEVRIFGHAPCAGGGGVGGVVNGGLELNGEGADTYPQLPDYVNGNIQAVALDDFTRARTGDFSYAITSTQQNLALAPAGTDHQRFLGVGPMQDAEGGAALAVWYRADNLPIYRIRTTLDGTSDWWDESAGWQRHTVCLPFQAEGRPVPYRFVYTPVPSINQPIPAETAYVDDMSVVYDAACAP